MEVFMPSLKWHILFSWKSQFPFIFILGNVSLLDFNIIVSLLNKYYPKVFLYYTRHRYVGAHHCYILFFCGTCRWHRLITKHANVGSTPRRADFALACLPVFVQSRLGKTCLDYDHAAGITRYNCVDLYTNVYVW